jgi:hypothetical protein
MKHNKGLCAWLIGSLALVLLGGCGSPSTEPDTPVSPSQTYVANPPSSPPLPADPPATPAAPVAATPPAPTRHDPSTATSTRQVTTDPAPDAPTPAPDVPVVAANETPTPTPEPAPTPEPGSTHLDNDNHYTNSQGNRVHSPAHSDNGVPEGATAVCRDGSYSFSQSRRGTCSHHGGVDHWLQ